MFVVFLLLYVCFNLKAVFAQEKNPRFEKEIKLNINFRTVDGGFMAGELVPVFILKNQRLNRHEFELSSASFYNKKIELRNKHGDSYFDRSIQNRLFLRYQYTHTFLTEASFSPYFAGALKSGWKYGHFYPGSLADFERLSNKHENVLEIIPGARWSLSGRFGIDFSVILPLIRQEFEYQRVKNPSLPIRSQRLAINSFYFQPFEQFHSRLGIYIKI